MKEPYSSCQMLEVWALFSLGEAAQWSQLTLCAGGAAGQVALAGGQVAAGTGGSNLPTQQQGL